jgi:hypothetical protein
MVQSGVPGSSTVKMHSYLVLFGVGFDLLEISRLNSSSATVILGAFQTDTCDFDFVGIIR